MCKLGPADHAKGSELFASDPCIMRIRLCWWKCHGPWDSNWMMLAQQAKDVTDKQEP